MQATSERGGETDEAPVVRLVQVLIAQALADRASDIHIEPGPTDLRVRYRVDGVLHEMKRLPREMLAPIVSRVKIMAELDIAERRLPQDGRVSATFGRTNADLRVSTLPTVLGEQVTIRMLDTAKALLSLDDLGFLPEVAVRYEMAFRRPYGAILATGPTGSGKTTTLYATLNALNTEFTKIITVEDPVEYQLPGIAQIQVNPKAGLTFARALRSILRSDPDVILVGEIRDGETAFTAVEAALTGHLVLSTLHTQDAASTPARLIEMGVEGHLVGSALDAIVAQRLTRRLCEKCRRPVPPTAADKKILAWAGLDPPAHVMQPVGCSACAKTGYSGRLALHEVLLVSEEIERLIAAGASSDDIRKVAVAQGMLTFRNVGLTHVQAGVTSLEEILRVVV
jgi:type IV pilus assembly protein PilB